MASHSMPADNCEADRTVVPLEYSISKIDKYKNPRFSTEAVLR